MAQKTLKSLAGELRGLEERMFLVKREFVKAKEEMERIVNSEGEVKVKKKNLKDFWNGSFKKMHAKFLRIKSEMTVCTTEGGEILTRPYKVYVKRNDGNYEYRKNAYDEALRLTLVSFNEMKEYYESSRGNLTENAAREQHRRVMGDIRR